MSINKTELLKNLRTITSAGMADCKAALEENSWDIEKATDAVKAKGLANTSRNANKVAAEGRLVVGASFAANAMPTQITFTEINSQTDFTANSIEFKNFAQLVGNEFVKLDLYSFDGNFSNLPLLEGARQELMALTKENIVVRRWFRMQADAPNALITSYLHSNNKLGSLVAFEVSNPDLLANEELKEFANNVAMQVVAMSPLAVSREQLPEEEVNRQKAIFEIQLTELKKPQASWSKIIEGKLNKWYSDVCLLDQEFVVMQKTSVGDFMKNLSIKLGAEIKISNFVRIAVGEGLEKKTEDFASAVNATINASENNV